MLKSNGIPYQVEPPYIEYFTNTYRESNAKEREKCHVNITYSTPS